MGTRAYPGVVYKQSYAKLTDSQWQVLAKILPIQRKRMIELKDTLKRVKKVLVDQGYQKEFMRTTEEVFGVKAEISSKPPSSQGLVPVKWRWMNERTFGCFNFFRRLSKDYEKTVENYEAWTLWVNYQMNISKL